MAAAGGGGGEGEEVRVLVVDDSPVDRRVVELLLRNYKGGAATFHVTAVDSGKKAIELLGLMSAQSAAATNATELTVDIVLTDYCMPEMTGYDLLKAIKALSSPNPIPVVVMSSENEPQRISRCLTAGAEDFILKPLRTKDVQRLRNCSNASKPREAEAGVAAGDDHCRSPSCVRKLPLDRIATSEKRSHLTGLAMVLNAASSVGLPHYLQWLVKLVLLAYAVLCLGELLRRWSSASNGGFLLSSLWWP